MAARRKIAVIGPVPPIKSGVARHTGAVARALGAADEVRVWSFRRQYPRMLYPGAGERAAGVAADDADWTLDGVGPWTWGRTARAARAWGAELAVLPAWTFFLAPALGAAARALRRSGVEVVMIVHNASDHEGAAWKDRLMNWQLGQADRFVTHNQDLAAALADRFPGRRIDVFPHPTFDDFPEPTGALPRERALELLFFGLVRPYKGLDILLDALAASGRRDLRLTVAGEFWSDLAETRDQIARLGLTEVVELIPRFVSDQEAAEYFHRADVVVLPYRAVTGSGVVPTACRYGRAVLASDLPGLAAVVRDGDTGWLAPPNDPAALARALLDLSRENAAAAGARAGAFGDTLTWANFADLIRGGAR